jgi:hypothetical protein
MICLAWRTTVLCSDEPKEMSKGRVDTGYFLKNQEADDTLICGCKWKIGAIRAFAVSTGSSREKGRPRTNTLFDLSIASAFDSAAALIMCLESLSASVAARDSGSALHTSSIDSRR